MSLKALLTKYFISLLASQDSLALNSVTRIKRQLEDFETDDFSTPAAQESEEESGFWDRMVKMALRLFNKFIEWLNAS